MIVCLRGWWYQRGNVFIIAVQWNSHENQCFHTHSLDEQECLKHNIKRDKGTRFTTSHPLGRELTSVGEKKPEVRRSVAKLKHPRVAGGDANHGRPLGRRAGISQGGTEWLCARLSKSAPRYLPERNENTFA